MKDAGSGKKRAGYDFADVEGVEAQALVQFDCTGVGLGPRRKLAKLLLDNGSGAIFHGATHNTAGSPKLRGKGKPWLHQKSPIMGIEPHPNLHTYYLPSRRIVNMIPRIE